MFLAFALSLSMSSTNPVGYRDLRGLDLPQLRTAMEALPAGKDQMVFVSAFGTSLAWTKPDTRKQAISELGNIVGLAHQKGYQVVADWNCLTWTGVKTDPTWRNALEDRAVSSYRREGEYDFVSPFDDRVHQTLLDTAAELGSLVINPPDAVVVTYQLPRGPFLACSQASRQKYLAETGLDPVDMLESTTLYQGDQPNKDLIDYLNWRITESNLRAKALLSALRTALPHTMLGIKADPLWSARTEKERGTKLNDWPQWLSNDARLFVLADSLPQVDPLTAISQIAATPTPPGRALVVWFMADPKKDPVPSIVSTIDTTLSNGHLLIKVEDRP